MQTPDPRNRQIIKILKVKSKIYPNTSYNTIFEITYFFT